MQASFLSNALGTPHEYRASFSDEMTFLVLSHTKSGGKLFCRLPVGTDDYKDVDHTADQVKQVNDAFVASKGK